MASAPTANASRAVEPDSVSVAGQAAREAAPYELLRQTLAGVGGPLGYREARRRFVVEPERGLRSTLQVVELGLVALQPDRATRRIEGVREAALVESRLRHRVVIEGIHVLIVTRTLAIL